ncbi:MULTISPECIES: DUF3179 domain-containing (seleno)protein [unclassified Agarivorans]|nr:MULTISPECIES: DUF3179 domain-containing (seleno)protein [unclassified Agarivorans]MDO6686347.1 DUF3179 domain-containing (seleno)protein [Agarivorans sp. 3_MG-2023]MDO6713649.1 DUF3179 domain-containing (seleno)protein [Agarivorans sp. 2_MG-2023]
MKIFFNIYALLLASFAIFCAVLMTEPGQTIGVPRDLVLHYFRYMPYFWAAQALALALLWLINSKGKFWKPVWMGLSTAGVALTFWAQSYAMPTAFPTEQFNAQYFSTEDADMFIPEEDSRVYMVELKGETFIFPRYHLQVPHVAGFEQDGVEYAVTYCGLSNLPMVVETDYGLGKSNLQVLGQVHNNLVFKDTNNGTAIQQITMQSEFTEHQTTVHPNTQMEWETAKTLYPDAQVYVYGMERLIDQVLLGLFEQPLKDQRNIDNPDFIFDTLNLADTRINPKQEIFGYDNGQEQIAIDPNFAHENNGFTFELGGETLQIFSDGEIVKLLNEQGEQVATHNGVHYGIWTQFFPNTVILS